MQIDRRWLFLLLALSVTLPFVFPLKLKILPREPVRAAYGFVETISDGSLVLLSFDYGPATKVELHPMAVAMLHQCFRKNLKVVGMALDPAGQAIGLEAFHEVAPLYKKMEGSDWAHLGYKAGNEAVVVALGLDFRGTFPVDSHSRPISTLPILKGVRRLQDFAFAASYSAGKPGALEHIRLTHSAYGLPLIVGATAVQVPEYYTYYEAGQLKGLLGGLRAAAEYEVLVQIEGTAQAGMGAQSVAHLTIAALIVISNLIYFWERRSRR